MCFFFIYFLHKRIMVMALKRPSVTLLGSILSQIQSKLTLKAPNKIAADDILMFYFYLSKKIRLDLSCESSA